MDKALARSLTSRLGAFSVTNELQAVEEAKAELEFLGKTAPEPSLYRSSGADVPHRYPVPPHASPPVHLSCTVRACSGDVLSPFQLRNRYWTLEKIARFVR